MKEGHEREERKRGGWGVAASGGVLEDVPENGKYEERKEEEEEEEEPGLIGAI